MKYKNSAPKRYLTAAERKQVCIIGGLKRHLEDFVESWEKLGGRKLQLKWARTSLTFTNKLLETVIEPLDVKDKEILMKEVRRTHIVMKSTEEAVKELKQFQELSTTVSIDEEELYKIVSYAVDTCTKCTLCDYSKCDLREVLMKHQMPAANYFAPEGVCQYQYLDIGENAFMDLYELESSGMLFRAPSGSVLPGLTLKQKSPLQKEYWDIPKIITN